MWLHRNGKDVQIPSQNFLQKYYRKRPWWKLSFSDMKEVEILVYQTKTKRNPLPRSHLPGGKEWEVKMGFQLAGMENEKLILMKPFTIHTFASQWLYVKPVKLSTI